MKNFIRGFALLIICAASGRISALPPDSEAYCTIECEVLGVMEWASSFPSPSIPSEMTAQADVLTGTATTTLYTNGNVTITADNGDYACMKENSGNGPDYLITEYGLEYDGDGSTATGGAAVGWTSYDTFLSTPSLVTHVAGDGAVQVTLKVRISNRPGNMANSGSYYAYQTITASWAG